MDTIIKKCKHRSAGFTIAEMLVAILIMLMVSSIVAMGIPVARSAYEKVVDSSNAEVLLSTTITTLRNELGTAGNISVAADEKTISYYNASLGTYSKIGIRNNDFQLTNSSDDDPANVIVFQKYAGIGLGKTGDITRLVSKEASTKKLYTTYSEVSYNNGIITFSDLKVNGVSPERDGIAKRATFSIRVISYN